MTSNCRRASRCCCRLRKENHPQPPPLPTRQRKVAEKMRACLPARQATLKAPRVQSQDSKARRRPTGKQSRAVGRQAVGSSTWGWPAITAATTSFSYAKHQLAIPIAPAHQLSSMPTAVASVPHRPYRPHRQDNPTTRSCLTKRRHKNSDFRPFTRRPALDLVQNLIHSSRSVRAP